MREKSTHDMRLWWDGAAEALVTIAREAGEHLPHEFGDPRMPAHIAEEIQNALHAAVAAADSAAHAFLRAARAEAPAPIAAAPVQTAPPAPMVAPPAGSEWAHPRPVGRGWVR